MHLVQIVYSMHMPTIELTQATYHRLLRRSTTFDDTPEGVIGRLLDRTESAGTPPAESDQTDQPTVPRATPGSILPEREYWRPILNVIVEAGGSAGANDVIEALGERMKDVLKPRDRDLLKLGEMRWRNRARFARLRMREQGLLSDASPRGVWEITDAGRRYLEKG
jgi:hypothetical protein